MRQRRLKNQEERLAVYDRFVVKGAKEFRGSWSRVFGNDHPVAIEVGCGKGKFLTQLAEEYPERNFIGVEGQESVVLRAMEKVEEKKLGNIRFVTEFIRDIRDYFAPGELSGLYLNFSDPWPKKRHASRRLVHPGYLEGYRAVLAPGSTIEMKTDNDGLFAFALESFAQCNMKIFRKEEDLHGASLFEFGSDGSRTAVNRRLEQPTDPESPKRLQENPDCWESPKRSQEAGEEGEQASTLERALRVTTEYEDRFRKLGNPIHFIMVKL